MASLTSEEDRLVVDFRFRGQRCREYLATDDKKAGRQIVKETEAAIGRDDLDALVALFPKSKRLHRLQPTAEPAPVQVGPSTFAAFAQAWIERQRPGWSAAHYLNQKSLLETHLVPMFGSRLLTDRGFQLAEIEDWRNTMLAKKGLKGPKLSPVLVNKSRALLATIIGRAVRDGHLTVNAVLDIKRQRQPQGEDRPAVVRGVRADRVQGAEGRRPVEALRHRGFLLRGATERTLRSEVVERGSGEGSGHHRGEPHQGRQAASDQDLEQREGD